MQDSHHATLELKKQAKLTFIKTTYSNIVEWPIITMFYKNINQVHLNIKSCCMYTSKNSIPLDFDATSSNM